MDINVTYPIATNVTSLQPWWNPWITNGIGSLGTILNVLVGIVGTYLLQSFLKSRETVLYLDVDGPSQRVICIHYKNLTNNYIHDPKISWECYLRDGYRIARGEIVSGGVLGPGPGDYKEIDLDEFINPELAYNLSNYECHLKLNYRYKFLYNFIECGSYHFKYVDYRIIEGQELPEKRWVQEIEKNKVKHWWQFWQQCPATLHLTLKDFEELQEKEKKEAIESLPTPTKEDQELWDSLINKR